MISQPEAEVLQSCFISLCSPPTIAPQPEISNQTFDTDLVTEEAARNGIDNQIIDNLIAKGVLNRREFQYCTTHGSAAEVCGCNGSSIEERVEYQIDTEAFARNWIESVKRSGIFKEVDESHLGPQRWEIRARLEKKDINFQLFFSESDLHQYEFKPASLEFGIAFLDEQYIRDEEYIFPWLAIIQDPERFNNEIKDLVDEYTKIVSATFIDTDDVTDFRRRVRNELKNYFVDSDYVVHREISKCDGCEKYDLRPKGDDLLLRKELEDGRINDILICRCDSGEGYHLHQFIDNNIISVENNEEYRHLLTEIENKIDEFTKIQMSKKESTKTANILAGVASLLSVGVFVDGVFDVSGIFSSYIPDILQTDSVAATIITINLIVLVFVAYIIMKPYYDGLRFSWDIENYS